jgi:hypothetical protein
LTIINFDAARIFLEELASDPTRWVMPFRESIFRDVKELPSPSKADGALLAVAGFTSKRARESPPGMAHKPRSADNHGPYFGPCGSGDPETFCGGTAAETSRTCSWPVGDESALR